MKHLKKILLLIFVLLCYSCGNYINFNYKNLIKPTVSKTGLQDTIFLNNQAKIHFINGLALQLEGKYAESIIDFNQALEYDESPGIYYAIGHSLRNIGRTNLAIKQVGKALDLNPKFIPAMELLAESMLYQGRINEAILVMENAVKIDPTSERIYTLAQFYERSKPQLALEKYLEIESNNSNYQILNKIVRISGKLKSNLYPIYLSKLYHYRPQSYQNADKLFSYFLENNIDSAIAYTKIFQEHLTISDQFYLNSKLLYKLTRDDKYSQNKIRDYLNFIKKGFHLNKNIMFLSVFVSDRYSYNDMESFFTDKALSLEDSTEFVIDLMVLNLNKQKNMKVVEIADNHSWYSKEYNIPKLKSLALYNLENYEKSKISLKESIMLNPNDADSWGRLGDIYYKFGYYDTTDICYNKAISLAPDDALINNNYAYNLSLRGVRLNEAVVMSELALKLEPNNPAYLDTYGWIQYQLKNYENALEFILKAIENGSGAEIYEHLGDIYIELNKKRFAIDAYRTALELKPKSRSVQEKIDRYK